VIDMPRTAQFTIENGYYHIITRGNQKQIVFKEGADYATYLNILNKYRKRHKARLYCYCLMPNHVHLLLEISKPQTLRKFMSGLNLSYTIYFNAKYNKVGHLWQDRYISRLIHKDSYLLDCISYIETNPIRANLVQDITTYPWSSYTAKMDQNNKMLDIPEI